MTRLTNLPGVARTNSQFTMKTIKDGARLPGTPTIPVNGGLSFSL